MNCAVAVVADVHEGRSLDAARTLVPDHDFAWIQEILSPRGGRKGESGSSKERERGRGREIASSLCSFPTFARLESAPLPQSRAPFFSFSHTPIAGAPSVSCAEFAEARDAVPRFHDEESRVHGRRARAVADELRVGAVREREDGRERPHNHHVQVDEHDSVERRETAGRKKKTQPRQSQALERRGNSRALARERERERETRSPPSPPPQSRRPSSVVRVVRARLSSREKLLSFFKRASSVAIFLRGTKKESAPLGLGRV